MSSFFFLTLRGEAPIGHVKFIAEAEWQSDYHCSEQVKDAKIKNYI
jgi:hypothetical protein